MNKEDAIEKLDFAVDLIDDRIVWRMAPSP